MSDIALIIGPPYMKTITSKGQIIMLLGDIGQELFETEGIIRSCRALTPLGTIKALVPLVNK